MLPHYTSERIHVEKKKKDSYTWINEQTVLCTRQLQKEEPCPLQAVQLFTLSLCLYVICCIEHLPAVLYYISSSTLRSSDNKVISVSVKIVMLSNSAFHCFSFVKIMDDAFDLEIKIWGWCIVTPDSRQ